MPTRKQRRRRQKELRHEYVWEDEEGNELDPSEVRETPARRARPATHAGREPQAPSAQRTLKRALIFAPIMFVTVMLLSGGQSLAQQVFQTLFIVVVFIPFSYFLDRLFWRSYQRRLARASRDD
jgi:cation transport ATPase